MTSVTIDPPPGVAPAAPPTLAPAPAAAPPAPTPAPDPSLTAPAPTTPDPASEPTATTPAVDKKAEKKAEEAAKVEKAKKKAAKAKRRKELLEYLVYILLGGGIVLGLAVGQFTWKSDYREHMALWALRGFLAGVALFFVITLGSLGVTFAKELKESFEEEGADTED